MESDGNRTIRGGAYLLSGSLTPDWSRIFIVGIEADGGAARAHVGPTSLAVEVRA